LINYTYKVIGIGFRGIYLIRGRIFTYINVGIRVVIFYLFFGRKEGEIFTHIIGYLLILILSSPSYFYLERERGYLRG
jgi:hypothetical protein